MLGHKSSHVFCSFVYLSLFQDVNPLAIPVDIGITAKPSLVTDNVTEVGIVAKTGNVSFYFNIVETFFIIYILVNDFQF